MSFMYQASMTRAPNKRKIKLNEENLLQLMNNSDGDDEEDEDFTITSDKNVVKEDDGDNNSSGDSESTEGSDSTDESKDNEDSDADKPGTSALVSRRKSRKRRSVAVPSVTVGEVTGKLKSKYYGMTPFGEKVLTQAKKCLAQSEQAVKSMTNLTGHFCSVCLNEGQRLLTCRVCSMSVHKDCYFMERRASLKQSSDVWICESCVYGGSDVVCEFCPNLFGCMKETKCGRWVHVICARSILSNCLSHTVSSYGFSIQLDELNRKRYGAKECLLCEDRLVAKTGVCVKCDAGLCKSSVHVTCAQKYGLLTRPAAARMLQETFIVNCPLHCVEEQMKKKQRSFLVEQKSVELEKYRRLTETYSERELVVNKLNDLRKSRDDIRNAFRSPAAPLEQAPRLLSSSAHFTKLLNYKAEKMFGINTKYPALIIPKPTEIRKKHNVAPTLTTEFAAYFMDRELRIEEERVQLDAAMKVNRTLLEKQNREKSRYNEVRDILIKADSVKSELKKEYDKLKQLFSAIVDIAKNKSSGSGVAKVQSTPSKSSAPPQKDVTFPGSPALSKDPIPDADSIIGLKTCGICNGQDDQHLLAKCDVCLQWQHLGCLDPPLTQMPKRTKFALWQCSECADSSSSSSSDSENLNRGSFICTDGRRATRRVRRVPEKLAIGFLDRATKRQMAEQSRLMHKHQKKLREALENIARQEFSSEKRASQHSESEKSDNYPKCRTQSTAKPAYASQASANLSLGISCDNYLSVAARTPIINQRQSIAPKATPKNLRKIIILKKAFPIQNRSRPAGLKQAAKKSETKPTLTDRVKKPVDSVLRIGEDKLTPVLPSISHHDSIDISAKSVSTQSGLTKKQSLCAKETVCNPLHVLPTEIKQSSQIESNAETLKGTDTVRDAGKPVICAKLVSLKGSITSHVSNTKASKGTDIIAVAGKPVKRHKLVSLKRRITPQDANAKTLQGPNTGVGAGNKVKSRNFVNLKRRITSPDANATTSQGADSCVDAGNKVKSRNFVNLKRRIASTTMSVATKRFAPSKHIVANPTTTVKTDTMSSNISSNDSKTVSAKLLNSNIIVASDGKSYQIPYSAIAIHKTMPQNLQDKPTPIMSVGEYMKSSNLAAAKPLKKDGKKAKMYQFTVSPWKNSADPLRYYQKVSESDSNDMEGTSASKNDDGCVSRDEIMVKPKPCTPVACSVCDDTRDQPRIVQCSTCKKRYHWECCEPPLKANPVSKYSLWECSDCVDERDDDDDNGEVQAKNVKSGSVVSADGRRKTSRRRKPPDVFEPAFTISNQQKIFKSIAKHKKKLRTAVSAVTASQSTTPAYTTAARCREIPLRYTKSNRVKSAHLMSLKGLSVSSLKTIAIVQKRTGPTTSMISFLPQEKTAPKSLSSKNQPEKPTE